MKATHQEITFFRPGLYQHYKGPFYRALLLGNDSTNRHVGYDDHSPILESSDEPMVCYVALDDPHKGNVRLRELWQWNEIVQWEGKPPSHPGPKAPRFDWVGP